MPVYMKDNVNNCKKGIIPKTPIDFILSFLIVGIK